MPYLQYSIHAGTHELLLIIVSIVINVSILVAYNYTAAIDTLASILVHV